MLASSCERSALRVAGRKRAPLYTGIPTETMGWAFMAATRTLRGGGRVV